MRSMNSEQLMLLYFDFCRYMREECGGSANMTVDAFYAKNRDRYGAGSG